VVTLRHPPPGPPDPEDDPTGMRALLSSLPDPGPMPDDLVSRITASLAEERDRRSPVVPITHRRRSLWRTAGLAAAAVAVIGIGGTSLLTDTAPGDLGALFGGGDSSSASSGAEAATRDSAAAGSDSGLEGQPSAVALSVHHSNTAYTSVAFAAQARTLLADPGETLAPTGPESPGIGPIGTETGLRSCLSALTSGAFAQVTADLGSYEGTPAAVLVLTTDAGHTAYAVRRSCSTGHPDVLAGPTPLP
jgi:hypothetical protein